MLLIFDWDGTLCDSAERIVAAMSRAADSCDLAVPEAAAIENIIGLGLQESVAALFPAQEQSCYDALKRSYSSHFIELDREPSPLFDGALGMLTECRSRGHQLAVATGKSRRGLNRVLSAHGLEMCFDASRCADETLSKPDPLMLHELLEETGSPASGALMIGDTEYDLEMASNAGIASVGVSYGSHSRERLHAHNPLGIVDSVRELLELDCFA
jgi:phosphoglycolate phosphatase